MPINPAHDELSAYLDGELAPSERAELERRLAEDPALQAELTELEGAVSWLRTYGPAQAPEDFLDQILARVEGEPAPRAPWWAWLRRPFGLPIEGLAVAAAAIVVALIAINGNQPDTATVDNEATEVSAAVAKRAAAPEPAVEPRQEQTKSTAARGNDAAEAPSLEPQSYVAVWSYLIDATDPTAEDALVQLARRFGGEVSGSAEPGAASALTVRLPGDQLSAFHAALSDTAGGWGQVVRQDDTRQYPPDNVAVQVTLSLPEVPANAQKAVPPSTRPTGDLDTDLQKYSGGKLRSKKADPGNAVGNAYDEMAEDVEPAQTKEAL